MLIVHLYKPCYILQKYCILSSPKVFPLRYKNGIMLFFILKKTSAIYGDTQTIIKHCKEICTYMSYSFSFQRVLQIQSTIRSTRSSTRRDDTEPSYFKFSVPSPRHHFQRNRTRSYDILPLPIKLYKPFMFISAIDLIELKRTFKIIFYANDICSPKCRTSSSSRIRSCFLNF